MLNFIELMTYGRERYTNNLDEREQCFEQSKRSCENSNFSLIFHLFIEISEQPAVI